MGALQSVQHRGSTMHVFMFIAVGLSKSHLGLFRNIEPAFKIPTIEHPAEVNISKLSFTIWYNLQGSHIELNQSV